MAFLTKKFQNARDKKRMKMEEMEETIKRLEEQNHQLAVKNNKLEKENKALVSSWYSYNHKYSL